MPNGLYFEPTELRLRVGTAWTLLTIESEVGVVMTARGYAPAIAVNREDFRHIFLVGARSLSEPLEDLRLQGSIVGRRIEVRKVRAESNAPYELRPAE